MKKIFTKIFLTVIILTLVMVVFTPQPAQAECSIWGATVSGCVAMVGNVFMSFTATILTFTGTLLNVSINLTTHIKDIYEATPAIRNVWVIIRNISSIFIIFMLLYSSIQTILGIGSPNMKKLIGNIIMAGLLINFSLFFTKVAIDASNLVSLQFYRAIAPEYSTTLSNATADRLISGAYIDGGLSNIFMQSLKIQKVYDPGTSGMKGVTDEGKITAAIMIASYGGIILMLFAAISFLAAAAAFAIRTGLLLILMAFSPIYFAGMIFPAIKKDVSNEWMKYLTNQLLFMPVYLLLMYVSMTVISDSGFMSFLQSKDGVTSGSFLMKQMGVVLQYVIAIFFINLPLIGALKFGAIGTKFAENMTKGLKEKIYNQPGFLAQHSIGRGAKALQDKVASNSFLRRNPSLAIMANKTLGSVAGSSLGGTKGGYADRYKKYTKAEQEHLEKGIKLNDKEKAKVVSTGLSDWDVRNLDLEMNAKREQEIIDNPYATEEAKRSARVELVKIRETQKARKEAYDSGESKQKEYLEKQELEKVKNKIAADMEKQTPLGFFTNKARKEAADAFRKEASKSEEKKILDKIKKMMKSEEEDKKPKDDKPKT